MSTSDPDAPAAASTISRVSRSARAGQPLSQRVYEVLRDLIVEGRFDPDTQLVQEQLAEELGVSRTPLRDALNRLAQEGFVTVVPGSGYVVNALSEDDVNDVYQVRENLESLATRLAWGRYSRVQLVRLGALIEEMAETDPADLATQFDLNRRFHRGVLEPCGNKILLTMIDHLWDHPVNRRITRLYLADRHHLEQMVREHRQILKVIEKGDLETMLALTTAHAARFSRESDDARRQQDGAGG